MDLLNISAVSLASILAGFSGDMDRGSSEISTYVLPAIAGQWEIQLDQLESKSSAVSTDRAVENANSGVQQSEEVQSLPLTMDNSVVLDTNQPIVNATDSKDTPAKNLKIVEQRRLVSQPKELQEQTKQNQDINSKLEISQSSPVAKGCRELYNFGRDNVVRVSSGDEWTLGHYIVSHREKGLPIMAMTTVYDNNEPDCSGNQVNQTGEAMVVYLDYNDRSMSWCSDSEGKSCQVHFNRVYP